MNAEQAEPRILDVSALIDGQRLKLFNVRLILLSWLVTLFDGLDMMVISYTAPYIRDELHLDPIRLGHVFSAGIAGMVLGGFGMSWLGDRIGRRPTILLSVATFGLFTLATAFARDEPTLLALRFLDGIALGGVLPLSWTLNIEYVPARLRATVVTLIMLGYSIGGAIAAPLTVALAPVHGWRSVFVAAGAGSLVCAGALALWLPESLRFLVLHGKRPATAARLIERVAPGIGVRPHDHFLLPDEAVSGPESFRVGALFAGQLRWITPLIWLGYVASTLGMYFVGSWGPILIEGMKLSRTVAAYVGALGSFSGAMMGLVLMRITDRRGPWGIVAFAAAAVPFALAIGLSSIAGPAYLLLSVPASALMGGAHFGIISIAGIYYPSAIRANGAGWAAAIAKIGGIGGPMLGASVLAAGLPIRSAYTVLALCPLVLGVAAAGIGLVLRRSGSPVGRMVKPPVGEGEPGKLAYRT